MPCDDNAILNYIGFIKKVSDDEQLPPLSADAVAEIIEYGMRKAGWKKKLSTKFSLIADLIREASYFTRKDDETLTRRKHVEQAIDEKILRLSLARDKIRERIHDGMILIETEGKKIGQINGLAVYNYGDTAFGKPSKITAQVSAGKSGIINIEREAKLSGKIHDKGILILSGYLRGKFAREKAFSLTASICFEQSYAGVDGDSASSTEVFALLSALADLPIDQGLAVTGSINQKGEIQPIGGVNHKIEGFFDICQERVLTGSQGVIIPHQNVDELMLRKDVVQAAQDGNFHIYPIKTVQQGIEILTGIPAGKLTKRKTYQKNSIFYRVDKKLQSMSQTSNNSNKKTTGKGKKKK